jgi:hypothetical protein
MGEDVDLVDRRVADEHIQHLLECVARQAGALAIITIGEQIPE